MEYRGKSIERGLFAEVEVGVGRSYEESSAYDVAERGWNEVGGDRLDDCHIGSFHHAERDEEHIGYTVFITERDKCHDRQPATESFLEKGLSAESQPHGEAYTPVGSYALEEYS